MNERVLTYTMDDRETTVVLTTMLGSPHVVFEVQPPYRQGTTPGVVISLIFSHDELEAIRQYMTIPVRAAMVKEDVAERQQMEVPFPFGKGQMTLCMSPNDIDNLTRHMREISGYARNLTVAGEWARSN